MRKLNSSIRDIPMPQRMWHLPISDTGYPVPWFVAWINGVPDFRVVDTAKHGRAVRRDLCWLCGQTLGRFKAFTIGPMCAVNRVSSEPPSHRDCAEYAVKACPFLSKPRMRRNDKGLPDETCEPGGIMLSRNPGVTLIWITRNYKRIAGQKSLLRIGEPSEIHCYAEGRPATRDEIMTSIETGLPHLRQLAEAQGADAVAELQRLTAVAMKLIETKLAA
jgi:hypothetical protein